MYKPVYSFNNQQFSQLCLPHYQRLTTLCPFFKVPVSIFMYISICVLRYTPITGNSSVRIQNVIVLEYYFNITAESI